MCPSPLLRKPPCRVSAACVRTGIPSLTQHSQLADMARVRGARCVVLGGAGFVGSHLCERLLDDGAAEVITLDNLITGSERNLVELRERKSFQFVRQDATEPLSIPGELGFVFNLASPASPVDYAKLPIETLRVGSI